MSCGVSLAYHDYHRNNGNNGDTVDRSGGRIE